MDFAQELDDLIGKCIEIHGRDNWRDRVMDALEQKLTVLRELEPETENT